MAWIPTHGWEKPQLRLLYSKLQAQRIVFSADGASEVLHLSGPFTSATSTSADLGWEGWVPAACNVIYDGTFYASYIRRTFLFDVIPSFFLVSSILCLTGTPWPGFLGFSWQQPLQCSSQQHKELLCGGIGYNGSTACISGAVCTAYNPYYSQCVPGTAATTSGSTTLATSTTKPVTTTSSSCKTRTCTSAASPSGTAAAVKYFINFGDSYSQTGFDPNSTKPSASDPLGNPPLPGWTASGGLNWVGFLASQLNTSTLLTYNFAYGGATTDASLVTPYASTVLSFVDQVQQFSGSIASHPSYAPWTATNTLVGVWIGVNDVGNSYWRGDETALLGQIMDRYFEQLQIVYDAGARNFVLLSVPPIDKTPMMLSQAADSRNLESTVIGEYNSLLASRLAAFKAANSGVTAVVVDTSVPFNTAIANPSAYGAPNATCYNGDGTSCLWFNDYHPGIAINKLVAQAVASAWKGSFF